VKRFVQGGWREVRSVVVQTAALVAVAATFGCNSGSASPPQSGPEANHDDVGRPCETNADCGGDTFCNEDASSFLLHRVCTANCTAPTDCNVSGAACVSGKCALGCGSGCPDGAVCSVGGVCENEAVHPRCTGEATSCEELGAAACAAASGCISAGTCEYDELAIGVFYCAGQFTEPECREIPGCSWEIEIIADLRFEDCVGSALTCSEATSQDFCTRIGNCDWIDEGCSGLPTSCAALSFAECVQQPGCAAVSPDGELLGGTSSAINTGSAGSSGVGTGGAAAASGGGGATSSAAGMTSGGGIPNAAGATVTGAAGAAPVVTLPSEHPITPLDELDAGVEGIALFELYVDAAEYAATLECVCSGQSANVCNNTYLGQTTPPERECYSDVTLGSDEGREFLECRIRAEEDFIFCVAPEDPSAACDDACVEAYIVQATNCGELADPTVVQLEQECLGIEPFVCDDGETILPQRRLCDLESDCADGADETISMCN
jgi:hypothetical protein